MKLYIVRPKYIYILYIYIFKHTCDFFFVTWILHLSLEGSRALQPLQRSALVAGVLDPGEAEGAIFQSLGEMSTFSTVSHMYIQCIYIYIYVYTYT